ncbi:MULTISPECIES: FadR/GntR family transcriptional regulator [Celeribacter]|uniref:FadR/GntR family transcriptional regulator n=1 Tax=Celeribacter halophilus TaxID=576117 RepID=A0A1I3V9Z3_9RHOB|nr:FadR/GntR family transcriptional regulator [Celeribacter halophilus]MBU2888346.1 FadR family transcriptional regulator [Celeribacter halophilus]MDO6455952.1 FadR/GntR family transcriptional regulator [Celeribacter halophilus]MDO6511935.1 FadR/GntR family transcriptional regulator [Celeribacter halophilus]MDO6724310.1 FadR/GntR family transcriptional regulator [Celeribacter halophilus]PZX09598.1 DNA-binding FadR family transcriptional regulator [Celeribacter halophilus]
MSETRRPSLADQVYDQLLVKILEEEYPVHSRLPAEDVLAQSFGVSRPIVRAALSRLRDDGIVQSRRGSGSYVLRRPDRQLISFVPLESISDVQRCYEFRIDVEGAAAAWAAERRDDDDLAAMEEAYRVMERAYQENELAVDADQRLHLAVARASKNPFFSSVLESLGEQIAFGVKLSRSLTLLDTPTRQELVLAEHRDVLDAIRKRQPEVASATMRYHITAAKDRMFVGTQDN